MKKIIISMFLLVFCLGLFGCNNLVINNIPSSDSILITKYENGQEIQTIIVEEIEVIEHITHNFNSLTVNEMDYIKPHSTMYTFTFYDCTNEKESKVLKKVEIETTQCLTFNDGNILYGIKKGEIDFEYIASLFTTYSNTEWQANETHHWYKSNSDTMYSYAEHENMDADLICDICCHLIDSQVPTNYFLRNQLGCEWLNEINVDNITEIKIITEYVGVAPGVLKNIASSIDKTVITKIYENCYWLDTTPISKEEGQISGGRATTIRFILNDSTVKEIYINNGNYKDPNAYYYKLLYIPKFSENDEYESSYGFITYLDTFEVYTLDGLKLGSFSGLSEYEFIEYPYDYIEENEDLGYIETEFGRIYIHSYDVFYIKDGNVHEFYLITSERTFYDLFSMDD